MTKDLCQEIEKRLVSELFAKKTTDNSALKENEMNRFQLKTKDGLFWVTSCLATDKKKISYYYFHVYMRPICCPSNYQGHVVSPDCQSYEAIERAIKEYPLGAN